MNQAGCRLTFFYEVLALTFAWWLTALSMSGQSLPPAQSAQEVLERAAPTPNVENAKEAPDGAESSTLTAVDESNTAALIMPVSLEKPLPLQVGVTAGGYYDDNIYLQTAGAHKVTDFIWSVSPLLAWDSAAETGVRNSVQVAYTPTLIFYQDHTKNDTVDEGANVVYAYEGDKINVVASEVFSTFQEDNADDARLVRQTLSITTINLKYQMTGKTDLSVIARQTYTEDDPGFHSMERTLAGYFDYAVTPKTTVGLGALVGAVDLDGPNQTYEQFNARASYDPDPKLSFNLTAGVEFRETEGNSGTLFTPDFSLGLIYHPFDGTVLGLEAYRRYDYSGRLYAEDYLATGTTISLSQRLFHRFYFVLNGSFEDAQYVDNLSATTANQRYDYFSVRPGLRFQPTPHYNLEVFYQYRTSEAQGGLTAFTDNQVGFSASFIY